MWHLFKFKRRPSLDIMERTTHDLTKQREFHEGERTAFEALAAHYSEAARQHREAAAALSDALMTLGVAADAGVAHVVLSAAIQDDIEAAKAVAAAEGEDARFDFTITNPRADLAIKELPPGKLDEIKRMVREQKRSKFFRDERENARNIG